MEKLYEEMGLSSPGKITGEQDDETGIGALDSPTESDEQAGQEEDAENEQYDPKSGDNEGFMRIWRMTMRRWNR